MADYSIQIGTRTIGPGHPCYIIAEMSANHGQSFEQALAIVHAAKQAGADAIKLQTYTPNTLTIDCDRNCFQVGKGTIWEGNSLYKLYSEAFTPWDWQPKLKAEAEALGMDCFSTPFDATAVDFLESMKVKCHKIASFELVDLPLIRKVALTSKPIIMSTGMATLSEIEEAVTTARSSGCTQLALLKCNSGYPAPPEEMNLRTIPHLAEAFGVVPGLSDHTLEVAVPVAAVTLGACIIEKHFTLSRATPGPDNAFSLEPAEFRAMVDAVRVTEKALGQVRYAVSAKEAASRAFRKSLFVVEDIAAGEPLTTRNVRCIRPADGLHPRHLDAVLASHAAVDLGRGTPLKLSHLRCTTA
jgi:pseudaminic acid synthase